MKSDITLAILILLLLNVINVANARSPLQFSKSSRLNKDQRTALLELVQGPSVNMRQDEQDLEPEDTNKVETRMSTDGMDDQIDSEGCMKKVVMVEEVEYDTEINCQHVSQESCFESYTTTFKNTETEECDESFKKECEIEYFKVPKEAKVELCHEVLTRNCEIEGPEVCSKEYETVCETKYEEHEVTEDVANCTTELFEECMEDDHGRVLIMKKTEQIIDQQTNVKLTPKTECRKEAVDVCGPESCPIVKGDRICKEEIQTVIHDVPQESCNLVPRKVCNKVPKVLPVLEPEEHCIDIPKEICAKSRINPVKKTRPVVRRWCTNESGDDDEDINDLTKIFVVGGYNDNTGEFLNSVEVIDLKSQIQTCTQPPNYPFSVHLMVGTMVNDIVTICGAEMDRYSSHDST